MLYLFSGPNEYACNEALANFRSLLPPDLVSLNYTRLDGKKLKLDTLAAACEAYPFLVNRRLVVVTEALKATKAGKARDELRAYLERVPATCDLIFVEGEEVDKRSTLYTYLKKVGQIREFIPLQGPALQRWLEDQAHLQTVRLDKQAAQRLISYLGTDCRALLTELKKLSCYVGQGNLITVEVVDLLVQDRQEYNLFAFLDDLSLRRLGPALRGLHELRADGQAEVYLLFMLIRQIRILLSVQELAARKVPQSEMAAQLRQHPFVIDKSLKQSRGFKSAELMKMHDHLLEVDRAIKTGRIQADVALELLVAEVCATEASPSAAIPLAGRLGAGPRRLY